MSTGSSNTTADRFLTQLVERTHLSVVSAERVRRVQQETLDRSAAVLLKLGPATYESDAATGAADMTAYQSGNPTGARSVAGRAQGLAIEFGKGRVVMTAEAAMFSAQVMRLTENGKTSETKMGMNVPGNDNQQFLLNIMRWLTRYLP